MVSQGLAHTFKGLLPSETSVPLHTFLSGQSLEALMGALITSTLATLWLNLTFLFLISDDIKPLVPQSTVSSHDKVKLPITLCVCVCVRAPSHV